MPPQGLFDGDLEEPPAPPPVKRRIGHLTFSHVLQMLLLIGLGVLIWQVVLLRQAVAGSGAQRGTMEVEVVNIRPIPVEVDNHELNVNVTNPVDANITNPELDVHVNNTVNVMNY